MLRGRRAGIAAALTLAAVAAVTAGCGGGSHALTFDPVSAAATKTQHAGAARVRFSLAFNSLRLQGTGAIDGTSGELAFDLPKGGSMQEVFLEEGGDFVVYLRAGFLESRIPDGKHWLKLDVSKLGKSAGIDLSRLMSGSGLAPTDLLSMLKTEGATIRKVGPATVDGIPTTRYHVTVDTAKALEAHGLTTPALSVIAAEVPKIPVDVWVGKDGLVHRIQLSFGLPQSGKTVEMTTDLYDYGTHVTIAAPPGSDVFDATQLAQQRAGSAFSY